MISIFNVLRELFYVPVILVGDRICNKVKLSYLYLANKMARHGEECFLLLQQMQARECQDCYLKKSHNFAAF